MRSLKRLGSLGLAAGLLLPVAACTATPSHVPQSGAEDGAWRLVAYDSCDAAIDGLRAAAKKSVGPYGFPGNIYMPMLSVPPGLMQEGARAAEPVAPVGKPPAADGTYSGTNTHEAAADEPDLVKTDGRRIVTVSAGALRVVDAASRTLTATLDLTGGTAAEKVYGQPHDLLLAGDHALVLWERYNYYPAAGARSEPMDRPQDLGPQLLLVSLDGTPRVLSRLSVDGSVVDARQVDSVARIVVRSSPHIEMPYLPDGPDARRTDQNRKLIDAAGLSDFLPRIEVTTGATTTRTQTACADISRPEVYTGTNLLTLLTIDLLGADLDSTSPVTIAADGETVYSNGRSLYVTNQRMWWEQAPVPEPARPAQPEQRRTEVYKFDISDKGQPRFVAGGVVPGFPLNQYAMSEWDDHLRVATTDQSGVPVAGQDSATESGVHVLAQDGPNLVEVGSVTGLGQGERIYAVRFAGPVGYVVTFRETDPLYTLDLSDPRGPAVRGVLKMRGYSAYLHPVGAGRLVGVGQNATDEGETTGTQVSLFDVGDLDAPARLATFTMPGGYSEAEFDPHAFLYWPAESLLVVPLQPVAYKPGGSGNGALVLRVGDSRITELGFIEHPVSSDRDGTYTYVTSQIRRSLVIGQTLWTVSDAGLMANDVATLRRQAWIPFGWATD